MKMFLIESLPLLFLLSWVLVGCFRYYAVVKKWVDIPNARSSHSLPTPRGGGIVFAGLWLAIALLIWAMGISMQHLVLLPGAMLVVAVGFGDDCCGIQPIWRFLAHAIAAFITIYGLTLYSDPSIHFNYIWLGLFGLAIIWSINLFNFMDGINGLAGIEACFIFMVGSYWLWQSGAETLTFLSWALTAVILGFLLWNFPAARIFMGDGGSGFLGFLIAGFALIGKFCFNIPLLLWIIIYGIFCFDTTLTLIRRFLAGDNWYKAHRAHAYQRLHQAGWSHLKIVAAISSVNILLVLISSWINIHRDMMLWGFIVVLVLLTILYLRVEKINPMYP
ncbi:MraY family glycosyltransferase [Candidatus Nitrosacidococcus sp. I8]|uniref:MraY family glycosyltransferase n=1 Tax=Candidatus Nitrosacidococcus sp. I8 TaxID=2942908 RepID=UPI0022272695|nr:glycosyltransferase family 4 protein [Candidatus Nitrosacidococcus sp. I8]CAH9019052.1 Undecaprenyl-phosphate alpha-N-acetylglucosaminyl 1-phosphate transferase [Candidatus Nitrosacidococcus sp. I8]